MPKEIAHIHFAELIASEVRVDLQSLLKQHPTLYSFGAMSPDLYYYDLALPTDRKGPGYRRGEHWGEILHGRDGQNNMLHIINALQALQNSKDVAGRPLSRGDREKELIFICGYLTHVAADTIFHPYVYSISGNYYHPDKTEKIKAEARHRLFETCMDHHILKERNEKLRTFCPEKMSRINGSEKILQSYASAISQAYSQSSENIEPVTRRSYKKNRWLLKLFQNRSMLSFLLFISHKLNKDISTTANLFYAEDLIRERISFDELPDVPHPVTGQTIPGNWKQLVKETTARGVKFLNSAMALASAEITKEEAEETLRPLSLNNGMERMPNTTMVHYSVDNKLDRWILQGS